MPPTRRTFLAGTSALALVPVLAACGETADPGAVATALPSVQAEPTAFPATIAHKYGSTEVTAAPQRVVVVGLLEQDALLALGVVPIAVTNWFGDAPGRIFPWATDALGDAPLPQVLDATDGINVEKVAGLRPDLIIGIYSGMTQDEYAKLSKLAPTVAQSADYADYGSPWDVATQTVGVAVGKPEDATAVVADVTARIARVQADHPEFVGATATCVTPYEGLFVYGPEDVRGHLLTEMGFTFPDQLEDPGADAFGWSLSAENTGDLAGVDVVVWLDYENATAGMTSLFEGTDTYAEGRYFDISEKADGDYSVAQSFVTALSIPYTLERYVPQLAAAVDGKVATKVPAVTS